MHVFDKNDGEQPNASLIQATDGNLYGTTIAGGDLTCFNGEGCGTVFKIAPSGTLTTLHKFEATGGLGPLGLVQATNGSFYGTAANGGNSSCFDGCGTIFAFSEDLTPFVSFVHNPARVGQTFGILGQGFIGTSRVALNGSPVSFTVKSATFLEATVPAGATTGNLTVTTPAGTLNSNVPFQVIP